ncbi:MAG: endonuclease/exonuclease/phosphatase family protein [Myxococcaceae bacterium]|nr:endonuclease/exonuclease/phosphatase family protein [Myxococcaceae bacterium]
MTTLRVLTWNVLHRVHGVNWAEACLRAFPDERVRSERIAARVARWLAGGIDAVCLQEVSGDQLAVLRGLVGGSVFVQRAPRTPRFRAEGQTPLVDASELLVTIAARSDAKLLEGRAYENDQGKGLLAVEAAPGCLVLNTHVTHGAPGLAQLSQLRALASGAPSAVVLGDFNAPLDVVTRALGEGFVVADVSGQGPTRVASPDNPAGKVIDHVVVWRGNASEAHVLQGEGLSDHHPVSATIDLDA